MVSVIYFYTLVHLHSFPPLCQLSMAIFPLHIKNSFLETLMEILGMYNSMNEKSSSRHISLSFIITEFEVLVLSHLNPCKEILYRNVLVSSKFTPLKIILLCP